MAKSKRQNTRETRSNTKSSTPSNYGSNSKSRPQTRSRSRLQTASTSSCTSLQERLQQTIDEANNLENPLASIPNGLLTINLKNCIGAKINVGCSSVVDKSSAVKIIHLKSPIPSNILNQCLQLFQINMAEMYRASSWGLDMEGKKEEFSHPNARFLVAMLECASESSYAAKTSGSGRPIRTPSSETSLSKKGYWDVDLDAANLVGFIHYRHEFDNQYNDEEQEKGHNNTPSLPPTLCQTYLYELQIKPTLQKCGLGHRLMTVLELSSRQSKMSKVVLTVFKTNQRAMNFYLEKLKGYGVDEMSPSNFVNGDECDYEILSKVLAKNNR